MKILCSKFALMIILIFLAASDIIFSYAVFKEQDYKMPLMLVSGLLFLGVTLWGMWITDKISLFMNIIDKINFNVMMASPDRVIHYMNESSRKLFFEKEAEIKKHIKHFSAEKLLGTCVDSFHQHSPHLAEQLSNMQEPMHGKIHIGSLNFEVVATPLWYGKFRKRGILVEWLDRTEQVKNIEQNEENERIRQALDISDTKLMVLNRFGNIVYSNLATEKFFKKMKNEYGLSIQEKVIKSGKIDDLYALFRKKTLIEKEIGYSRIQLETSGLIIESTEKEILNEKKENIGKILEWENVSEKTQNDVEIEEAISRILKGDLSQQISVQHKTGIVKKIAEGLNQLMSIREGVILETVNVMSAVSTGDLTFRVEKNYDGIFESLKKNVNLSCNKLTEIILKVRECSDGITEGSEEISKGNYDLNNRTQQQASTLEQTAASIEEMSNVVKENAFQSKKAFELSQSARKFAQEGGLVANNMVKAMGEINSSSIQIQNIIGVIDEIAFQTNLLALNAAVEAARAGEQGRGFAVVASEVRSLAQRSASSAKEIQSLISDSAQKVKEGERLVNDSKESLQHIVSATEEVNQLLTYLSESSNQQSQAIIQINTAVSHLDSMTQKNASLVEEVSASSEKMDSQVKEMQSMIGFFKFSDQDMRSIKHEKNKKVKMEWNKTPDLKKEKKNKIDFNPNSIFTSGITLEKKNHGSSDEGWEEF